MQEKVLITSALPYANGPLHFGHIAGAYLPADCYARYRRLKGDDVLYICGSDEYGVAITLNAEMTGHSPQEHVNIYHEVNSGFFKKLNISFDHYSRTTSPVHAPIAQEFFLNLFNKGYIEEHETEQLYSSEDNRFLADRYVVGTCPQCGYQEARGDECPKCGTHYDATELKNPRSKLTKAPLVLKATRHWFLRLDLLKEKLTTWIEGKKWKTNVIHFVKKYIDNLQPRPITRDLDWGIPVPLENAKGKVLYVWFDAPIGYISATVEWAQRKGDPERWKSYWLDPNTKLVNFIGKDNIPFHAVIFPAMIMGQDVDYKLVDDLPANEFYNLEGRQFSKSDGWYIELNHFFENYTTDQIRYAIAANAPETSDSEFTWKDFQVRCNGELLGKFGNLVNRTLVFARNHCSGMVPECGDLQAIDVKFLKDIRNLVDAAAEAYKGFHLRRVCQIIMELAQVGNVYFDHKKPWIDAKSEEGKPTMATSISCCLECLKNLALIAYPVIPETTGVLLWQMLGFTGPFPTKTWEEIRDSKLTPRQVLPTPKPLFKKIEDSQVEEEIEKLKVKHEPENNNPLKEQIVFNDFEKVDIRVSKILEAEKILKSDKLLKLKVDTGFDQRTIISGISKYYEPHELIGKQVLVVVNLKPTKIMGVASEGMVLCASKGKRLEVVFCENMPLGSEVS